MTTGAKTVVLWETTPNLNTLAKYDFNFQFAKSVIGPDGNLTFNIVWQSQTLQPITEISWTPEYALNWTQTVPAGGATVRMGGLWQPCAFGQVWDITSVGTFEPSNVQAKPNFLKIGKNGKSVPGTDGIHIIVGLKNATGRYDPIYVDSTALGLGMSAIYQPQEQCQWWYEKGARTSTMISGASTTIHSYNMSIPNPTTGFFYVSTTYDYGTGSWIDSPSPPPTALKLLAVDPSAEHGLSNDNLNMQTLQRKMNSLEDVLSNILRNENNGFSPEAQLPSINFRGIVNWPVATTIIAMTAGVTVIAALLIARGYSVEKSTNDRTKTTTFRISRDRQDNIAWGVDLIGGVVPVVVEKDWNDAFNDSKVAITDKATNGGIWPGDSALTKDLVMSHRKIRARDIFNENINGNGQTI